MSNFFIEKRQVTIVKLLKTRWANKLKNLLNQESIIFNLFCIIVSRKKRFHLWNFGSRLKKPLVYCVEQKKRKVFGYLAGYRPWLGKVG